MARRAAEREGVFVMHFASHHPAAPGAALGRRAKRRVRPEGEAGVEGLRDQRRSGQALDGDAEEDEVDVRIDRRTGSARPAAGRRHGASAGPGRRCRAARRRADASGATRHCRKVSCRSAAFMSYWRRSGIAAVSGSSRSDAAVVDEPQDARRREDHLRQRGEVEPCLAPQGFGRGLDLRLARASAPRACRPGSRCRGPRPGCCPASTAARAGAKALSINSIFMTPSDRGGRP